MKRIFTEAEFERYRKIVPFKSMSFEMTSVLVVEDGNADAAAAHLQNEIATDESHYDLSMTVEDIPEE